ncbi:MAG: beta-glucuronidase [bacterium]|nr:beta-glucuronidase [bacterium]
MGIQISLEGIWDFRLDPEKQGLQAHYELEDFEDVIRLPATVSTARKGVPHGRTDTGFLTDPYEMSGYSWYRREIPLPFEEISALSGKYIELTLERTRVSYVWVDGVFAGSFDSFAAPHRYDLTGLVKTLRPVVTVMISNTDYKIPGGHMTSPDTQTNWNGILGGIFLNIREAFRLGAIETLCELEEKTVLLQIPVRFDGAAPLSACIHVLPVLLHLKDIYAAPDRNIPENAPLEELVEEKALPEESVFLPVTLSPGSNLYSLKLDLSGSGMLWDEEDPYVYRLTVTLSAVQEDVAQRLSGSPDAPANRRSPESFPASEKSRSLTESCAREGDERIPSKEAPASDTVFVYTGLRSFAADGMFFSINGRRTFLRGKHDGMLFPETGHAPMDVHGWLRAMKTVRNYGINHYRFHTCCPPEAAFVAADLLGIYLQPELPFWGTFNGPQDEGYNAEAQLFLETEGFRMLKTFGNHPSYCMMSMGNELWGNASAINNLLMKYKAFRPQILFTQGSNNFQWSPNIQPGDDFFSGVRFSRDRLIRGSYAMCDKPQGHIQTAPPDARFCYDNAILPTEPHSEEDSSSEQNTVEIQQGTGVRRVKLSESQTGLVPFLPVVSHEIGQYETYPDFSEIDCYTGVLKPRNLQEFKRRLEEKGMLSQAEDFFRSSGALAAACYKSEIETALRSRLLAGFQLLDLQDFTGQGTALVGMLNSFLESKGLISPGEWRQFCSDGVLLAEFDSFVAVSGQDFPFTASLCYYRRKGLPGGRLSCALTYGDKTVAEIATGTPPVTENGKHVLGNFCLKLPELTAPAALKLRISLEGTGMENNYVLWCYPRPKACSADNVSLRFRDGSHACPEVTSLPQQKQTQQQNAVLPGTVSLPQQADCAVLSRLSDLSGLPRETKACLLFLSPEENKASLPGTYCTDFWCYPMFRNISLNMHKEVPVGTMGLLIQKDHGALKSFPCERYSTPQWYSIVTASRSTVLDGTELLPIVQTIDNFERNHRLGLLYELYLRDLDCGVLVCTSDLPGLIEKGRPEADALLDSLLAYLPALANRRGECYSITLQDFTALLREAPEDL